MTNFRLHWRSLRGPETAPTSAVYADLDEARAVIGYMNTAQDGAFHWWAKQEPAAEAPAEPDHGQAGLELPAVSGPSVQGA